MMVVAISATGLSQKYAYINSQEIFKSIPDYQNAQKKLDDLSEKWQKDIEEKYAEIDKKDKAYQEEKILLPDEIKKKREAEIAEMLNAAREFQKAKFGVKGELFTKRQELIQPIQEKLYKAIKDVAKSGTYAMVFDMANQSNLVYADPKLNINDRVKKSMGY